MEHTGVVITKDSWTVLQDEPLYSARFLDREGTEELILAVRVEELDWFVDAPLPLTLNLATWQSSWGSWVVAIAYQLHPAFGGAKAGVFYLNPHHADDVAILRKLRKQDSLVVIFLSQDCGLHYTTKIPHAPQVLAEWNQQLTAVDQTVGETLIDDEDDPDFEAAQQAFQNRFSIQDILTGEVV